MSKPKAVFKTIAYVSCLAAMALSFALTPFTATTVRADSGCCLRTGCPVCSMAGVCNQGSNCACDSNNICTVAP